MTRYARIQLISLIVLVGFIAALAYHYYSGFYLAHPFPESTFLYHPSDVFRDFINVYDLIIHPDNAYNPLFKYRNGPFQFGVFVIGIFGFYALPTLTALYIYLFAFASTFLFVVYRQVRTTGVIDSWKNALILGFLSYPFLISVDRANVEGVVVLLVVLFGLAFQRQRMVPAVVSLALAIALKPFPVVFLALFLRPFRLKCLVGTVALTTAAIVSSVLIRLGSKAAASLSFADDYQWTYAIQDAGLGYGHSLWGLLKIGTQLVDGIRGTVRGQLQLEQLFSSLARPYFITTALLFGAVTLHVMFRERVLWKKVALLVCSMNLLPFVSGDYKLLHLYLPLFLFINAEDSDRLDAFYATLFGLLLIPKSYYYFPQFRWVSLNVALNPCLMILLATVIVTSSWMKRRSTNLLLPAVEVTA